MLKRKLCQFLVLALLSPAASQALGLGDIHLKSALNAPLDAEIDIVGATAEDLAGLKAQLAPRDQFTHAGLDYPAYFSSLKLTEEKTADGRSVLHVRSLDPVTEPFATLLVEADWPRGHVVREYTVLIDPPTFSQTQSPASAAVAAPTTGNTARGGSVERPAQNAGGVSAASRPAHSAGNATSGNGAAGSGGNAGGSYTVRRGDTLSSIAAQNYPNSDHTARERELVGIYRANTSAFEGNMNVLRSGSRLQLPGDAELQAISPGEASAEVHRQYQAWNGAHGGAASGGGQLHLVTPQEPAGTPSNAPSSGEQATAAGAAAAGKSAAAGERAALNQRVQQLESQLADSQRLLQVSNEQLKQLQSRAGQNPAKAPAAVIAPPAGTQQTTPAPSAPAPASEAAPPPAVTPPAVTPPAPVAVAKHAVPPPPPSTTWVDLVEDYWYVPAILLLIVIFLLGMRVIRSRQEEELDRSLGRLHPAFDGTSTNTQLTHSALRSMDTTAMRGMDTAPMRRLPSGESYRVEESGAHEQPTAVLHDRTIEGRTAATGEHIVIEDTVTGEHPVALDQGDPLAEADFHMAYGLYDQAADLVQIAMSREPNRRDLKLKLLEVFFVWGNKERFLQTARELSDTRTQALPGEWEKVVIMGRQIAPDDPLFASSTALAGAASGGVDLNLEGGQNRVDFDLLGEPTASHDAAGEGLDLDLGAALGDTQTAHAEPDKLADSGVDFVLDDPERGNDATGSTREMLEAPPRPAGATATMQVINTGHAPSDAPTIEQAQLPGGENSTIREKLGAAARGAVAPDQTAELALDDLGLDLGRLDSTHEHGQEADETILQGGPDAPTMLAGMDEETRHLFSQGQSPEEDDGERTQITPQSAPSTSESGTWLFTDSDLSDLVLEQRRAQSNDPDAPNPTEVITQMTPPPAFDTGATGRMESLARNGLDLDLGHLGEENKRSEGIDLDVGAPSISEEGTYVQTQKIAQSDVPLPDLEPATMSEVGTKLDLARAYMDMGDPEGARSILSEVLSEGSVSQKQEARRLMDTLPG